MEALTEDFKLYRGSNMTPDIPDAPDMYWDDVQAKAQFYLSGDQRKHRTWLRVHINPVFPAAKGKLLVLMTMKPGPLGVYTFDHQGQTWREPLPDTPAQWRVNEKSVNGLLNKISRGIMMYENVLVLNTTSHVWAGPVGLANAINMCNCYCDTQVSQMLRADTLAALRNELQQFKNNGGSDFDFVIATGPFEPRNGGRERIEQYTQLLDEVAREDGIVRQLGLQANLLTVRLNAEKKVPGSAVRITAAIHPNASTFALPVRLQEVHGAFTDGTPLRTYTLHKK